MTSELDLVQIGPDDVDPVVLTADGVDVAAVLARFTPVTRREVDLAALPTEGWREVSRLERSWGGGRFRFLAPHRDDPSGWALLTFMTWSDGWLQHGDPGPLFARPGRPSRRRSLRLCWPGEPIVTQTGREPTLTLSLQNVSDEPWVGTDAIDTVAFILDLRGQRLPGPSVWTRQPVREQRSIPPGGSVVIIPKLVTSNVSQLSPGNYGLEAKLEDLELTSEVGMLKVVPGPAMTGGGPVRDDREGRAVDGVSRSRLPGRPNRDTVGGAALQVIGRVVELFLYLRHRGPSGPPTAFAEIHRTLRNGVTLERAEIHHDGVRITYLRPRSGPSTKELGEQWASRSREDERAATREDLRRQREDGLIFDAPVLRLRRQGARRFIGGELSGGGNDRWFSGDTWFRIRRDRLGDRFTLKCVDERVEVQILPPDAQE